METTIKKQRITTTYAHSFIVIIIRFLEYHDVRVVHKFIQLIFTVITKCRENSIQTKVSVELENILDIVDYSL